MDYFAGSEVRFVGMTHLAGSHMTSYHPFMRSGTLLSARLSVTLFVAKLFAVSRGKLCNDLISRVNLAQSLQPNRLPGNPGAGCWFPGPLIWFHPSFTWGYSFLSSTAFLLNPVMLPC